MKQRRKRKRYWWSMSSIISNNFFSPCLACRYTSTHSTKWTLNTPLINWWRRLGVRSSWMSVCGNEYESCPCGDMMYAMCISLSSCGFQGNKSVVQWIHKEALTAKLDREERERNWICKKRTNTRLSPYHSYYWILIVEGAQPIMYVAKHMGS